MQKFLIITLFVLTCLWAFSSSKFSVDQNNSNVTKTEEPQTATTTEINLATTTLTATTTEVKTEEKLSIKTETKKAASIAPTTTPLLPVPPPEPPADFVKINEYARKAVVNILCSTKSGALSPISGTGVVISPDGIILTNAHVGQYLLLKDIYGKDYIDCVIRVGSPAYPTYKANLVYISPVWVNNNKSILKSQDPKGTGENDFAFLKITEMIDGSKLPDNFDYIVSNVREVINENEPVILVSYPAGFLGGLSIIQGLSVASSVTTIQKIYTYKERTVDLISIGGTILSQKGASGGAVIDRNGTLLGIITTSSDAITTSNRDLRAITLSYINRDLQVEQNITLNNFLSIDLDQFSKNFLENTAPGLIKMIKDAIAPNY